MIGHVIVHRFPNSRLPETTRFTRFLRAGLRLLTISLALGFWLPAAAIEVGQPLRITALETLDGKRLAEDDFVGRYVIVEVWASWCPFCRKQNVNLQALYEKTRETGLRIVTLAVDKDPENTRAYISENEITFPVAMMTPEMASRIGKRRGIPELYVVDPSGIVVQKDFGQMVDADFAELIRFSKPAPKP